MIQIEKEEKECHYCGKTKQVASVPTESGGNVFICEKDLWKFLELQGRMNGKKESA